MNAEFRQHKQVIRSFMQAHYTDERLAQLLAHAQSGRLSFYSCCCFIGIATADHALRGKDFGVAFRAMIPHVDGLPTGKIPHYDAAHELAGGVVAEYAYQDLGNDAVRRRILIPMIRAEIRRRDKSKVTDREYCAGIQEVAIV